MATKTVSSGGDGQVSLTRYLSAYEPHVRVLFQEVLKVARSVGGRADERAYPGWGMRFIAERGEVTIAALRDRVNVRMRAGATEHDASGLLRGTGKTRHVPVRTVEEAGGDELRRLLAKELKGGPRRLKLSEGKGKRILERVRRMCLALPDASEKLSHGTPSFFVRGKQFAQVWAGHHDEPALQLWCTAPPGAQAAAVGGDAERYFVPPYVGHRGWLGVRLDSPDWGELTAILADAHAEVRRAR